MTNSTDNVDRITQRRAQRNKKKKRNWTIKVIGVVLFVYLFLSVIFTMYSGVTTTIALKGVVEEEIMADGYIFRDQKLIKAPTVGYLECRVDEGERVTEEQAIAYIYTGEYDAERFQKMQEIGDEIARLEGNDSSQSSYADHSVLVEQKISVAARDLADLRQNRDLEEVRKYKDQIDLLLKKKEAMESGEKTDPQSELQALKDELQALEDSTGGTKLTLRAPMAGVFSTRIDGLEEKLSMELAETVTPAYLAELDRITLRKEEAIVENEPVCKVINNYGWCFAASINEEQAESLSVGQGIRLRFFDMSDTMVYGTIRSISQEEKGKVAISVYTNRYVEGIYGLSRASAAIVTTSVEGIKLPVESLHVKDGQTGVYVLRLDVARFVPVHVRYKNDEWAVVRAVLDTSAEYKLQIYDEVIVSAKNLEDGKVVR